MAFPEVSPIQTVLQSGWRKPVSFYTLHMVYIRELKTKNSYMRNENATVFVLIDCEDSNSSSLLIG
jgi:hypothetical protein